MKKKEQESKSSFVRLTRLDGSPIWLNASFVVTIEPRKGGGSVVVPIGDGLDYDVKEPPEAVLAALDGAPVPEVVPVPASDALTPTPDDVSPEPDPAAAQEDAAPAAKPAKKTARKASARSRAVAPSAPPPASSPEASLPEEAVERLRKMAPRTVKKLHNTIMTQFKNVDVEAAVAALASRGLLSIDGTRVNWFMPGESNFAAEIAREANANR